MSKLSLRTYGWALSAFDSTNISIDTCHFSVNMFSRSKTQWELQILSFAVADGEFPERGGEVGCQPLSFGRKPIITTGKRSLGARYCFQKCVRIILFTGGEGLPPDRDPLGLRPPPPSKAITEAGGKQPTGMHTCLVRFLLRKTRK